LQKELRFKLLSVIEATKAVFAALVALGLAWMGLGYWALVGALVAGTVYSTLAELVWARHEFSWPRMRELGKVLRFSSHVISSRLSWYCYNGADFLVAGRLLGAAPLGLYSMARSTASIPLEKVTGLITSVTPAFFSSVQHDRAALRRYLLSISQSIALLVFPMTVGLALVAEDLVAVLLGEKWAATVVPLQLLSVYVAFRCLVVVLPQLMFVTGQSRFNMYHSACVLLVLPIGFVLGSRWGVVGISVVWASLYPVLELPALWRVFRSVGLGFRDYIRALVPPASSVAVMALAVLAVRSWMSALPATWLVLTIEVIAGAIAYLGTLFVLHRSTLIATRKTLSLMKS
jgi:O-antigen/teichoic acid export membrane protein